MDAGGARGRGGARGHVAPWQNASQQGAASPRAKCCVLCGEGEDGVKWQLRGKSLPYQCASFPALNKFFSFSHRCFSVPVLPGSEPACAESIAGTRKQTAFCVCMYACVYMQVTVTFVCIHTRASYSSGLALCVVKMCSLAIECVLLLQNVFFYYRMCSFTIKCVFLL